MSIDFEAFPFRFRAAARKGELDPLRDLLQQTEELTPDLLIQGVEAAAGGGQPSAVRILIETLRPNDAPFQEALIAGMKEAALWGRVEVLQDLVEQGADPTLRTDGQTLLHRAAWGCGSAEPLRWLAQFVAVDEPDRDGATALMLAAEELYLRPVTTLRELDADPLRTDHRGRNAFDYAKRGLANSVFDPDWQHDRSFSHWYNRPLDDTSAAELYIRIREALT
jgi:ankyrin repeat protein